MDEWSDMVYNTPMAKRNTGVGAKRAKLRSPHKTAKRLEAKRAMLVEKAGKNMTHTRRIASV
jgi:hypothetical protein